MRQITVGEHESGQRLERLLAKYLDQAPKSFLYKMMRKKNITLNGKKAAGNEKVVTGDVIRMFLSEETIEGFSTPGKRVHTGEKLDILYENRHVMLVNKPAGMLSQKAAQDDVSMVEHVISHLWDTGELTEEMEKSFHPSVCNRLDRNTSGILVAGKTLTGLRTMSELIRERNVRKFYLCIVCGCVEKKQELKGYLYKDEKHNQVRIFESIEACARSKVKQEARFIHTRYRPLAYNGRDTLLEVELLTGRTHQIRAHLSFTGHPLYGDPKYGRMEVNRKLSQDYGLKGQLLHAYCLEMPKLGGEFADMSGRRFYAPVPELFLKIAEERGLGKWRHGVPEDFGVQPWKN